MWGTSLPSESLFSQPGGGREADSGAAGWPRIADPAAIERGEEVDAAVEVVVREQDPTSADTAAENIVRKQLSPLGAARAVGAMLDDGLTLDGAAEALGWMRALVREPEPVRRVLDTGALNRGPAGSMKVPKIRRPKQRVRPARVGADLPPAAGPSAGVCWA